MPEYTPGLHILCTFSAPGLILRSSDQCRHLFNKFIAGLGLQKVGEVYHDFPEGGFTGVVCLTESHVSIHTWPEFGIATFDVFLSNFHKDNAPAVRSFFQQTIDAFAATVITQQEIMR